MRQEHEPLPEVGLMDASSKLPSLKGRSLRGKLQAIFWWADYVKRSMAGGYEDWGMDNSPNLRALKGTGLGETDKPKDQIALGN